ncbi:hypothetical protein OG866_43300 [Streptomyces sp. NBC_00663]|uniref:hypothetical protein n=1 Tax=Streptomyces sp. NBC_00663 TaxID=2975801 RepID=UPI002E33E8FD|nr:hypothetical protein [Streptomyces sp. NBC_00663]
MWWPSCTTTAPGCWPPLGATSDVVVRGELTTLLRTQIPHNPALAAVFEEIFTARGGELAPRSATGYVRPGSPKTLLANPGAERDVGLHDPLWS